MRLWRMWIAALLLRVLRSQSLAKNNTPIPSFPRKRGKEQYMATKMEFRRQTLPCQQVAVLLVVAVLVGQGQLFDFGLGC